ARGDFATYSDIDILIVLNKSNITFKKRIDEFYKKIGYYFEEHFLSPIVLTVEDLDVFHSFYLGIFENYITLYDKAGLINKVVSLIKEKIDNGEIIEHSYPKKYWRILYAKDEISR
ncbi:MAG: hypothetical protein H5U39_04850, partial [Deferribacterales bacterium]|nr:hypothetical protein [Deferribacterales bacterium]